MDAVTAALALIIIINGVLTWRRIDEQERRIVALADLLHEIKDIAVAIRQQGERR